MMNKYILMTSLIALSFNANGAFAAPTAAGSATGSANGTVNHSMASGSATGSVTGTVNGSATGSASGAASDNTVGYVHDLGAPTRAELTQHLAAACDQYRKGTERDKKISIACSAFDFTSKASGSTEFSSPAGAVDLASLRDNMKTVCTTRTSTHDAALKAPDKLQQACKDLLAGEELTAGCPSPTMPGPPPC